MAHKVMIELNEAQHKAATAHAKKKGLELAEDLVRVWWGRMKALADYSDKIKDKKAKFRPYAPRLLKELERVHVKKELVNSGHGTPPAVPKVAVKKPTKKKAPPARPAREGKKVQAPRPAPKAQKAAIKKATKKPAPKEAPAHLKIDLIDGDGVARAKAKRLSESTGKGMVLILKEAGRRQDGSLLDKRLNAIGGPASAKADAALKATEKATPPAAVPPVVKKGALTEELKAQLKAAGIGHPEVK